jgi:signal transduction histidine kinase
LRGSAAGWREAVGDQRPTDMVKTGVEGRWSEGYPPDAEAVRVARQFVLSTPPSRDVDQDLLAMAASELISNAVLHGRTPFVVTVRAIESGVRVEVTDGNRLLPRPKQPSPDAVTGRGLAIVAKVATAWGVEPTVEGKTVWFELTGLRP